MAEHRNSTFNCKLCNIVIGKKRVAQHYRIMHITEKFYPCPFCNCPSKLKRVANIMNHVYRCHLEVKPKMNSPLICPNCASSSKNETFPDAKRLFTHLRLIHLRRSDTVRCFFKNCSFSSNVIGTWNSHISRYHDLKTANEHDIKCSLREQLPTEEYDLLEADYSVGTSNGSETDTPSTSILSAVQPSIEKSLAVFFLKMLVIWTIPEYVIQDIFETFSELHNLSLQQQLLKMTARYRESSPNLDISTLTDVFNRIVNKDHYLGSTYRRKLYFTRRMPYVAPGTISSFIYNKN